MYVCEHLHIYMEAFQISHISIYKNLYVIEIVLLVLGEE